MTDTMIVNTATVTLGDLARAARELRKLRVRGMHPQALYDCALLTEEGLFGGNHLTTMMIPVEGAHRLKAPIMIPFRVIEEAAKHHTKAQASITSGCIAREDGSRLVWLAPQDQLDVLFRHYDRHHDVELGDMSLTLTLDGDDFDIPASITLPPAQNKATDDRFAYVNMAVMSMSVSRAYVDFVSTDSFRMHYCEAHGWLAVEQWNQARDGRTDDEYESVQIPAQAVRMAMGVKGDRYVIRFRSSMGGRISVFHAAEQTATINFVTNPKQFPDYDAVFDTARKDEVAATVTFETERMLRALEPMVAARTMRPNGTSERPVLIEFDEDRATILPNPPVSEGGWDEGGIMLALPVEKGENFDAYRLDAGKVWISANPAWLYEAINAITDEITVLEIRTRGNTGSSVAETRFDESPYVLRASDAHRATQGYGETVLLMPMRRFGYHTPKG